MTKQNFYETIGLYIDEGIPMKTLLAVFAMILSTASFATEFRGVDVGDAKAVHTAPSGLAVVVSSGECSLKGRVVSKLRATLFNGMQKTKTGCVVELNNGKVVIAFITDNPEELLVVPIEAFNFKKFTNI